MRNGYGGTGKPSRALPRSEMDAYDRLPRSVRHALSNAIGGWSAVKVWRAWEACRFRNAKEVVRLIRDWDRQVLQARAQQLRNEYGVTRNEALRLCGIKKGPQRETGSGPVRRWH
jgi:hypothetical protein